MGIDRDIGAAGEGGLRGHQIAVLCRGVPAFKSEVLSGGDRQLADRNTVGNLNGLRLADAAVGVEDQIVGPQEVVEGIQIHNQHLSIALLQVSVRIGN